MKSFKPHELYLIYNPSSALGKKTRALASSICEVIHDIDPVREEITPLQWKKIIDMMGRVQPMDLINHRHPDYSRLIHHDDYSEMDALEILYKNPSLLIGPIGIFERKAVLCDDPNDIFRLEMSTSITENRFY